jgi:transcriptional regulator with XRE-family HTH domain
MDFRKFLRQELERDPEFRREWEADEPARKVAHALIGARCRLGWTQTELAQRMGTTQANISRAENTGRVTPHFLARFAAAVGGRAVLTLELPDEPNLSLEVAQLTELAASRRLYREPGMVCETSKPHSRSEHNKAGAERGSDDRLRDDHR